MIEIDASHLNRFMSCNGSYFIEKDGEIPSDFNNAIRDEGNAAHWLASICFDNNQSPNEYVNKKAPNGIIVSNDMASFVSDYIDAIIHRHYEQTSRVEVETNFKSKDWIVNGRADHIGLNVWSGQDSTLFIDDFKFGYSIVEPYMNWTLIWHAIGFCLNNHVTPEQIIFTIYQPRAPHPTGDRIRHWTISYDELINYYNTIQKNLTNPTMELSTGSHCYKCSAFINCPARQKAELNAIEVSEIVYSSKIENNELELRIKQISRAIELLNQSKKIYEELAFHRIRSGQVVNGYSVRDGLANTSWKEYVTPELIEIVCGINVTVHNMLTPKQAGNKGVDKDIVALFTERKPTGPKLVEMSASEIAAKIFGKKS